MTMSHNLNMSSQKTASHLNTTEQPCSLLDYSLTRVARVAVKVLE